jgi:polyisoprenoid-binding protein YceI
LHYAADQSRISEAATVRYLTDGKASKFTVRAFSTGLLSAFAHNPTIAIQKLEGEALVNLNVLEESSLRVAVEADSLTVTDDISEKDREEINRRMQTEVLESDGYPKIVYECSQVSASKTGDGQYWLALSGELTLRGVTRSLPVSARVSLNGDVLRATGDFSMRLSDYEIRPVTAAGGAIKLKDELKLSFDVSARRQA